MKPEILPLRSPFPGKVYYVKSTGSTMELARELIRDAADSASGFPEAGTVIMAGEQTRGRGRLPARSWHSPADESLLFTVLFPKSIAGLPGDGAGSGGGQFPLQFFPLAMGLAVAKALEKYGLTPRVKWPNDVLADRKKICGILCETAGDYLAAGIGINCGQGEFPPEIAHKASSLFLLTGKKPEPPEVLADVLEEIGGLLDRRDRRGWLDELTPRLFGADEDVVLVENPGGAAVNHTGRVLGLGGRGELLFKTGGRVLEVFSGELVYT